VKLTHAIKATEDFGDSILPSIREILLKDPDLAYEVDLDLPYIYGHVEAKDDGRGRIRGIRSWQTDDEKVRLRFRVPEVTTTRAKPPRYVSHASVPDGEVVLTREPVCGPNLTPKVVSLVHHMYVQYLYWSLVERTARCFSIFSPLSAEAAWDIEMFAPGAALPYELRRTYAPQCARPRDLCGRSVSVFGQCVNIQILNYVQWGAITAACDRSDEGEAAMLLRNQGNEDLPQQHVFYRLGRAIVQGLREERSLGADEADRIDPEKVMRLARAAFNRIVGGLSRSGHERWRLRREALCPLACDLHPLQSARLRSARFRYTWGDDPDSTIQPGYPWGVRTEGKLPE
jgi:hypothetical protein